MPTPPSATAKTAATPAAPKISVIGAALQAALGFLCQAKLGGNGVKIVAVTQTLFEFGGLGGKEAIGFFRNPVCRHFPFTSSSDRSRAAVTDLTS
jgi:hypothetical protein